jgi:hypothetical protein
MGFGGMGVTNFSGAAFLLGNRRVLLGVGIERTVVGVFLILAYKKSFRRLPLSSQSFLALEDFDVKSFSTSKSC